MSGVGTEKTLGMKDAHKSKDCIAYFSANGYIWSSGACSVGGRSISDGEIITVGVDRNRNTISWSASNKILATSQLPPTFSNQQLFWLVLLVHENDSVEILLDWLFITIWFSYIVIDFYEQAKIITDQLRPNQKRGQFPGLPCWLHEQVGRRGPGKQFAPEGNTQKWP